MKFSILVSSGSRKHVLSLLEALKTADLPAPFEILLSWSGAAGALRDDQTCQGRTVKVSACKSGQGSAGANALAREAEGEFLLLLGEGVIPDQGAIAAALAAVQADHVGIVGANLRSPAGRLCHAGVVFSDAGEPSIRDFQGANWKDARIRNDMFVPAVSGLFLLVSRVEFLEIGLDEALHDAGEDILFCLAYRQRFRKEVLYVAGATAEYAGEGVNCGHAGALPPARVLRKPGVHIVTEQPGWILHRKAAELQERLGNVKINEDWPDADIHYFINYGMMLERPASGIVVANFTHYDPNHLGERFIEVAGSVDHCVAVSQETADQLRSFGVPEEKITVILVGADSRFEPKLTLGVVGRTYEGGRKGEDIVRALALDPEVAAKVRLVAAHPGWELPVWTFDDMADFYRSIDYLLVPSRLEGGPVPFMEALACGTLAIAPPVGVVPQFPHVEYPAGDQAALREVILRLADEHLSCREHLSSKMFRLDWHGWAAEHDKLFRALMHKTHGPEWHN